MFLEKIQLKKKKNQSTRDNESRGLKPTRLFPWSTYQLIAFLLFFINKKMGYMDDCIVYRNEKDKLNENRFKKTKQNKNRKKIKN